MRFVLYICLILGCSCAPTTSVSTGQMAAEAVLERTFGAQNLAHLDIEIVEDKSQGEFFSLKTTGDRINLKANSPVAACRGAYQYFKKTADGFSSWSGTQVLVSNTLPSIDLTQATPYSFRYYFNVVTHGYTTAYWDWKRWEKEIDWMATHGINMPLIPGAHEAILRRVFLKIGLTEDEVAGYFSGPAHFPWNRMGNLNGWDGPVPETYFQKQIDLTHSMLKRMTELDMTPIVHAFAGFVPKELKRLYPNVDMKELGWGGGLPKAHNAYLLSPHEDLFIQLGTSYIQEWEKEFGTGTYYLADSFNEMDVPVSGDESLIQNELAEYGQAVYQSIIEANPQAVWTMQGWTFPFHKDNQGKLFWTPDRLEALISKVPNDKLLILDLANEYNHVFWKIDPSWKMYSGFFGKKWIYSFIPNMGGKTPFNGVLDVYASIPIEALNYPDKGNLVGFGFAPEGVENNEIIYELLSDMGWRDTAIDLDHWIENYCTRRYGSFPDELKSAFDSFRKSCLGSFDDHPMHRFQLRPYPKPEGVENRATVHTSEEFKKGVQAFLSAANHDPDHPFFLYDALEFGCQYLGLIADEKLLVFLNQADSNDHRALNEALDILLIMDRLLASHPNWRFEKWIAYARAWGDTPAEKDYYEKNAKRLLSTWGGDPVNDYSGRVWSGLIRDYYVPRWRTYHTAQKNGSPFDLRQWEEAWIQTKGITSIEPYENPLEVLREVVLKHP